MAQATSFTLDDAVVVFARAIAFCRCFTYPSEALQIDGLWVIRDEPRKQAKDYRREEWVGLNASADQVHAIARRRTRGRYCICAIRAPDEPEQTLRDGYRSAGYRLGGTEALMVHDLKSIGRGGEPVPIVRVQTPELADKVAKAAGRKQILPGHLETSDAIRLYAAIDGDEPVGWLRSIVVGDRTCVSNVYVKPSHRRRGIASAMQEKMLRDDRRYGSTHSLLTATHTGQLLYESLGYRCMGVLYMYTPLRKK